MAIVTKCITSVSQEVDGELYKFIIIKSGGMIMIQYHY